MSMTLPVEVAAVSAQLADLEQPAFACSTGTGEAYSIPLVQLLKLCGCYHPPHAEVAVHRPPLDPAGDRMLGGPTRYGFIVSRAPLLWELPGSEGGKREAMWRRRLDRMVGPAR